MGSDLKEKLGAAGRTDLPLFDPDDLTIVQDNPKHPLYNERPETPPEATVRHIMRHGVHSPIKVRFAGNTPAGKPIVEVVFGTQRVRAARIAQQRKKDAGEEKYHVLVPATVTRGSDAEMMDLMISENEHRRQSTPLARARLAQRQLNLGASEEDCCLSFRITDVTLQNWKALLECCQEVQDAVEHGQLAAVAAIELSKMDHDRQRKALAEMIESGATKGYAAVEAAENAAAGKPARATQERARIRPRRFLERARDEFWELRADPLCKNMHYAIRFLLNDDSALVKISPEARDVFKALLAPKKTGRAKE